MNEFSLFVKANIDKVKEDIGNNKSLPITDQDLSGKAITEELSKRYNLLDEKERNIFKILAENDKKRYEDQMDQYYSKGYYIDKNQNIKHNKSQYPNFKCNRVF